MDRRTILFVILMAASFYFIQLFFHPSKDSASYTPPPKQQEEVKLLDEPSLSKKMYIPQEKDEALYVIENDFQQLVFSTAGGCITEINLPFKSKENTQSVVNEIKFDKQIASSSKDNALFPLKTYTVFEEGKITKKQSSLSGYNPLLRRHLIGSNEETPNKFYALNIIS